MDNVKEMIMKANCLNEVLDVTNLDSEFRRIAKMVHPDLNKDKDASDVFAKLQYLKDYFLDGEKLEDDAGSYRTNGYFLRFSGEEEAQKKSLSMYTQLMVVKKNGVLLQKYLPKSADKVVALPPAGTEWNLLRRGIPISKLPYPMPQKHVNWILSRMLEFTLFMHENKIVYGGYNPNSIFVTPEDHGIQVVSFYHSTIRGKKMSTISASYRNWYPSDLFVDKIATHDVDIELAKRTAAWLLGDKSGLGAMLKRTHNIDFVNFLLTKHHEPLEAYNQYRELLNKNFKKEFHILNI